MNDITTLSDEIGLSWLKNSKCESGCVFGIETEITTFDNSYNILSMKEEIEPGSIDKGVYLENNVEKEFINFKFINENYSCSISYKNKITERIEISGTYARIKITDIGQLVVVLGEPDYFYYGKLNPEMRGCFIQYIWKELQLAAVSGDGKIPIFDVDLCKKVEKNNNRISKHLNIDQIVILSQSSFMELKQNKAPNWVGFIEDN